MLLHLLKTTAVPEPPSEIEVVDDYGFLSVRTPDGLFVHGNHILVEASEEALEEWLKPLDGFWLGVGSPFMQQFEVVHWSGAHSDLSRV